MKGKFATLSRISANLAGICGYGRYAVITLNLLRLVELFERSGNLVFELRCIALEDCVGGGALLTVALHEGVAVDATRQLCC
jgi:hypothetical protein